MKAIVQDAYGHAGVLALRDVARPVPKDDEVLVEVRAAGVDPGVWIFMTGTPYAARLVSGLRRPKVGVRGRAFAGVVAEAGSRVTGFGPGDEVYGTSALGTYAELVVARPDRLAAKPARLSFAQAAAVPISGVTALQAVREGDVREGRRVLVVGAAGGIGTFAVQIAAARGARVTGVCGSGKAGLVRSIGAADVIDYTHEEVDRDGPVYDLIIDIAGMRPLSLLRRALTPRGTLVLVGGGHQRGAVLGGMERQMGAPLTALFSGQRLRPLMGRENAPDLEELGRLIDSGDVTPVIGRTYPLDQTAEALRHIEAGHPTGKIVVTVGD